MRVLIYIRLPAPPHFRNTVLEFSCDDSAALGHERTANPRHTNLANTVVSSPVLGAH